MFINRQVLIATQHSKEKVIQPLLEEELGVECVVNHHFDTDTLGTFSGEIERKDDALITLRKKCVFALKETEFELVIASEGSFGAHPSFFFVPANDELIMFLDVKNNIEIVAREICTETNYAHAVVSSREELYEFSKKALFPSHALILKSSNEKPKIIYKGIQNEDELIAAFDTIKSKGYDVFVETDMRAMFNPSRMKVIEKATRKLLKKINNVCPDCFIPGFDVSEVITGLPCEGCGLPTASTLAHIYKCKKCNYKETMKFPYQKKKEEQQFCNYCNP